ncbi:hypothetical protein ACIQ9P_38725 [Kitasatospora sp. NPDC094019]|uniref:hypothetical protein n=1 Tax=Kitasatospora sp. NPDC094019 TaxID=3364091 RepID=UPI00382F3092
MPVSRFRTMLLACAAGTLAAGAGLGPFGTAQATPGASPEAGAMPTAVEDFLHPGAGRLLEQQKITLKQGDGRIRLKEEPVIATRTSCDAHNEIFVESSLAERGYCFTVDGTAGYLAMELPDVYMIWTEARAVTARVVAGDRVTQVNVRPKSVTPVGQGVPGQASTVLVELRVTG